jgi:cystathionine beta-lyase
MAIFDVPLSELRTRGTIKWQRFEPDVIPMFVAEMDAHAAPAVRERLERALREGDTGYPQLPTYQEAFADYAAWQWGWRPRAAEVKLATDVVTGMRDALVAVTEPGDGVVINSPIYPPFRGVSHDRTVVDVPVRDGRLDLAGLAEAFATHRPKAYLLCSPHNPVGTIHTAEELTEVARLAAEHGVVVISDEIHAPLAGAAHVPYLAVPGAANAALKAGLIVGDPAVLRRLGPMVSDGASYFGILAHAAALTDGRDWLAEAAAEIEDNKRFFRDQLAEHLPALTYEPAPGTYLAWLDCAPLGLANPARHFHEVARVRFSPGVDFEPTATQHVRVNLATSEAIIAEAVARLSASVGSGR